MENIKQALEGIDINIKELANAICDIVEEDYGTHNYEVFKSIINERLKK